MRQEPSAISLRGVITFVMFGVVIPVSGCGGSGESASRPATEEAGRFNSLQKLGAMNTKEIIAAKKKEALALRPKNKPNSHR
ncbi:hypothetical protein ACYOEI_12415 [Singulisphaera rosea]